MHTTIPIYEHLFHEANTNLPPACCSHESYAVGPAHFLLLNTFAIGSAETLSGTPPHVTQLLHTVEYSRDHMKQKEPMPHQWKKMRILKNMLSCPLEYIDQQGIPAPWVPELHDGPPSEPAKLEVNISTSQLEPGIQILSAVTTQCDSSFMHSRSRLLARYVHAAGNSNMKLGCQQLVTGPEFSRQHNME